LLDNALHRSFIYLKIVKIFVQKLKETSKVMAVFEFIEPARISDLSIGFQKAGIILDYGKSIEVDSDYLSFFFYKMLVNHTIVEAPKDIEVKFATRGLSYLFSNFDSEIGMYLEKGKKYYIEKVGWTEVEGPGAKRQAVHVLFKEYKSDEQKNVDFYLLFKQGEEAYARRAFNFFSSRIADPSRFQIIPGENVSSVVETEDLNEVFMYIDPVGVRIKAREIYKLTDVGLRDNTVFIRYEDIEGNDFIYRIEGYGEDTQDESRSANSIYNYFKRNINDGYCFFVSAIDILDSELDYMIADPHGEKYPRLFRFSKDYESLQLIGNYRWNEISCGDFAGRFKKFYPNRVP